MVTFFTRFALTLITAFIFLSFSDNTGILGVWYTTDNKGKVEIYRCGDGEVCGKIIWLKDPNEEDGTPKIDINNPEEELQDQPIVGLRVMHGFEKTEPNKWEDGRIYDPENGKTYKCNLTLEGDVLNVRGYIGFSLLGRTEQWHRAR